MYITTYEVVTHTILEAGIDDSGPGRLGHHPVAACRKVGKGANEGTVVMSEPRPGSLGKLSWRRKAGYSRERWVGIAGKRAAVVRAEW